MDRQVKQHIPRIRSFLLSASQPACIIVWCGLITLVILGVDFLTESGQTIGLLYVLVVLLAAHLPSERASYGAALIGTVCVLAGWWLSPLEGDTLRVAANRGANIFVFWVAAGLIQQSKNREKAFRTLVEGSAIGKILIDQTARITLVNEQIVKLFGYSGQDLIGQPVTDLIPGLFEDTETNYLLGQKIRNTATQTYNRELVGVTKSGLEIPIEIFLAPIPAKQGKRLLASVVDLSEREAKTEKLATYARQQQVIAALGQNAILNLDLQSFGQEVAAGIQEALGLEYCEVWRLQPDGESLMPCGLQESKEQGKKPVGCKMLPDSLAAYVFKKKEPVVISDLSHETRFFIPPRLQEVGMVCGVSYQIPSNETFPFGFIEGYTSRSRTFSEDDVNFIRSVAHIVSNAIQRKNAEEAVKLSQKKYKSLIEHIPDVVYSCAPDKTRSFNFLSNTWEEWTGQVPHVSCQDPNAWLNAVDPRDRDRALDQYETAKANRTDFFFEYRIHHNQMNKIRYVRDHGIPVVNEVGQLVRFDGILTDITVEKQREKVFQRLAWLLDRSHEAIIVWEFEGEIIGWNRGAEELYGWSRKEAIGRRIHDFLSTVYPIPVEVFKRQLVENSHWVGDLLHTTKNGQTVVVESRHEIMQELDGRLLVCETNRNVTHRKEKEQHVKELNIRLEQDVEKRNEALKRSQENLRRLASELTLAEHRERRRLAMELHDYLAQLLVVCRLKLGQMAKPAGPERLASLLEETEQIIDESLTYTRSLVAELSPQVLYQFGLVAALKWLAAQMKKNGLTVDVQSEVESIPLDEDVAILVYQAVRELLMNVRKHAGVDLAVVRIQIPSETKFTIIVEDQGKGFDPDSQKGTTQVPKFGLLSLYERLEALKGKMEISSSVGQGTRVILTVPFQRASQHHLSPHALPPEKIGIKTDDYASADTVRVVLVDDMAMVREGLRSVLHSFDNVEVVGEGKNGQEAIELAECYSPDVLVMDVNMPKLNGIEATRQIVRRFPNVKVIGLSVNNDQEIRDSMLEAGALAYLPKDSAAEDLYAAICTVCGRPKINA